MQTFIMAALALFSMSAHADFFDGITVGLQGPSTHFGHSDVPLHNNTVGIYALTTDGYTFGGYRNSFGRPSFHVGLTAPIAGPFDITLGLVTGYHQKLYGARYEYDDARKRLVRYKLYSGHGNGRIKPLVAVSMVVPVGNVALRFTATPPNSSKHAAPLGLSIEHRF